MYGEQYEESLYDARVKRGNWYNSRYQKDQTVKNVTWNVLWYQGNAPLPLPNPPLTPALIFSHLIANDVNIAA